LETKRYIGNDTTRIFARVRAELGPDAVIVRTRSLLREGAEPLIEVLAAPTSEPELSLAMQRSLIEGALARVEFDGKPLTIGDLEDLATRESTAGHLAYAPHAPAEEPAPDWLEGFVPAPHAPAFPGGLAGDVIEPFAPPPPAPAPPPVEWRSRPRIVTRERPAAGSAHPTPFAAGERFTPVEPGVAGLLVAAGFSAEAARLAASTAPGELDPARALEATIAAYEAAYPVDGRTAIISIQGPAGAGRTTALMRMALDCADAGRPAVLVAADTSHTGGPAQVRAYAEAIGIPVFDAFAPQELVHAVTRAPRGACIFVDVPPGRWAPPPIPGVEHFAYLAMPAHWSGLALRAQLAAFEMAACAGAVITHTDLVTGLAPILSLVMEARLGLAFLSSGRDVATGIDVADPLTLASGVFTTSSRETTNGRLVATA
jgi:flagellar biosynthesis GTPase FlhF